jgi:ribosomal protein S18 acetylase RimI-like enzyme
LAFSWLKAPAATGPDARPRVRPAGRGDAAAIAGMASALSRAEGGFPSRFTAETYLRDGFGPNPAFRALIAELGEDVAGYAVYYPGYDTDTATRGVYLADLFVREEARRQGVGRALVTGVAEACRAAGGRWMFWSVLRHNKAGRRFYKALAPELKDVIVCAAFGRTFDRLADMAKGRE